jgi:hypothetical protein
MFLVELILGLLAGAGDLLVEFLGLFTGFFGA